MAGHGSELYRNDGMVWYGPSIGQVASFWFHVVIIYLMSSLLSGRGKVCVPTHFPIPYFRRILTSCYLVDVNSLLLRSGV